MSTPISLFGLIALLAANVGIATNLSGHATLVVALVCALFVATALKTIKALALCSALFFFTLTISHYLTEQTRARIAHIPELAVFEGVVNDIQPGNQAELRALVQVRGFVDGETRSALSSRLRLVLAGSAGLADIQPGDLIRFAAKIEKPLPALSPGAFDGISYALTKGIDASAHVRDIQDIAVMKRHFQSKPFAQMRSALRGRLLKLASPEQVGLLMALIAGETALLSGEQNQMYRLAGASHLLAVSGMQVSIMAVLLFKLFTHMFTLVPLIGRRGHATRCAALVSLLLVWFYVLICQSPPSAARAGVMASIVLLASQTLRACSLFEALALAFWIQLLFWPLVAIDAGFLLSYAAVLGLALSSQELFKKRDVDALLAFADSSNEYRLWGILKNVCFASIAASLTTLPLTAYLFGEVAPIGIVSNILMVPVASLLQLPAIAGALVGAWTGSALITQIAVLCAGTLEALCDFFAQLIPQIVYVTPLTGLGCFTAMLVVVSLLLTVNRQTHWALPSLAGLCFLMPFAYGWLQTPTGLRISVLPVGQGDSSVFELPSGHTIIIDGGGTYNRRFDPAQTVIIPFLHRRMIKQIDAMIVSHPDPDHILGLITLAKSFPIKEIWHSGLHDEHPLMRELLEVATKKSIATRVFSSQVTHIKMGDTDVRVWRPAQVEHQKTNDQSMVVQLCYARHCALWPGDLEAKGEADLMASELSLKSTILKAPHHGSRTSSTQEFTVAVSPPHVVFSTGPNNHFHFPNPDITQRWQQTGAILWDTAVHGLLTIWLTKDDAKVTAFNPSPVLGGGRF